MKRLMLVLFVFIVAVGVACTTTPTPPPLSTLTAVAPTAAPTVAPTVAPSVAPTVSPIDAAKKEGKLTIYTSLTEIPAVAAEFNKVFPEIKIEYFRSQSEDITARITSEYQANTFNFDVVEDIDVSLVQLLYAGVLGQYKSPELSAFPPTSYDKDGLYATDRANLLVIAYNTNLVKKELAPKTWDDLLDSKWTGQIAVEPGDYPLLAYSTLAWGEARAQDFWSRLATRNVKTVTGHTELANAIANGDFALSPTVYAHRVEAMKQAQKPIEWVRTDPIFEAPNLVAIAKNPKNPNAARVFIDWILSTAGQQALANQGRIPIRPGIKTKPEGLLTGLNLYFSDPRALAKAEDLQKKYRLYFGIK